MADTQQPPNPSRRRLFSWLTDREQAGKIGAEAGRLMRQALELAQELNDAAQDAAETTLEPVVMAEPVRPALPEDIPAANADLHADWKRIDEAVATLLSSADASRQTDAALLQNQIELAGQLQALQRMIDERLPQAKTDVERSHLEWLRGQIKHLITLFLGATGAALYEALVSDAVYEPIKAWLVEQTETIRKETQPASPVQTPEATPAGESVRTLRAIMQDRRRPARERLDAGLRLSDLGVLPEGLDDFIAVPGTNFGIGKYPVTNYQFRRFVEAGGYGEREEWRPPWWSVEGWKWRQKEDWTKPRAWDDASFNRATQPVVGISWYEADAYCAWLNHVRFVPAGHRAQLPTQEQWMLAARNGRRHAHAPEVDYPWGGVFDPALANTQESGLRQTTPVDMHPDGATPAGVFDLAGNVVECTCNLYIQHNSLGDLYWVKGGGYEDGAKGTRTSAAIWVVAGDGFDGWGCRVVVVPILRFV